MCEQGTWLFICFCFLCHGNRPHLYTSASIFSMVATSGWVWPEDFSRSSKACWHIESPVNSLKIIFMSYISKRFSSALVCSTSSQTHSSYKTLKLSSMPEKFSWTKSVSQRFKKKKALQIVRQIPILWATNWLDRRVQCVGRWDQSGSTALTCLHSGTATSYLPWDAYWMTRLWSVRRRAGISYPPCWAAAAALLWWGWDTERPETHTLKEIEESDKTLDVYVCNVALDSKYKQNTSTISCIKA